MSKRTLFWSVAILVTVIIWFVAGYRCGLVVGKGWRAAVINSGCEMRCPPSLIKDI